MIIPKLLSALGFSEKRCAACTRPYMPSGQNSATDRLCGRCQKLLAPYLGPKCKKCGIPWQGICSPCVKEPPPWDGLAYYGLYSGHLRDLILRLKFSAHLHLSRLLGELLLEPAASLPAPDYLLAIPQFPAHLRQRGFNQAHEIARELARAAGFALAPGLLARTKAGPPQEGLSAEQRKANLQDAFLARPEVKDKAVWLIDDVLTTGSTCASATLALKAQGAKAVYLLFIARTPR